MEAPARRAIAYDPGARRAMVFRFGAYELDTGRYELRRDGASLAVEPKVLDVLLVLVRERDRLVTKQALLDAVWPGVHVTESTLTRAVSLARAAVGDSAQDARVIETVSGRGYRWKALVEVVAQAHGEGAPPAAPTRRSRAALAASFAALAVLVVAAVSWPRPLGWALRLTGAARPVEEPALPPQPSLVVLPFVNLGAATGHEHVADGIAEDLTAALVRFPELFVISRHSAMTYKGREVAIGTLARELGVRYAVEGTVRIAGERLVVTSQLVDAKTGVQTWADRFEGPLGDVVDLQGRLGQRIAEELGAHIGAAELERLRRRPTDSLDAYELFLRGRHHFYALTREDHARARELFSRAVALDPAYEPPSAYLGALALAPYVLGWDPAPERISEARRLSQRALELDPFDAMAHTTLATASFFEGDTEEAQAHARTAVELGPSSDVCHGVQAAILAGSGEPIAALRSLDRALRLNPRQPHFYWMLSGHAHELTGQPDVAIAIFERLRESNPDLVPPRLALILQYRDRGDLERARALAAEVAAINPALTSQLALRVHAPARGDPELAAHALEGFRAAGLP